ncbi:MAG: rhodanese-like domain-containing protein [Halioglobus sp.]|nr:rhodanese-like domain-containing protein [Halioglobus sp.]
MQQVFEFTANHSLLAAGLILSFFVLVFSELQRKARGIVSVEPQEAVKLINSDALVIDLRSADAFARGHIVNAKSMPFDELAAHEEQLKNITSTAIVAVCDSGMTTSKVVNRLRKTGIENIYSMRGGMNAWIEASLPVVGGKKSKKK